MSIEKTKEQEILEELPSSNELLSIIQQNAKQQALNCIANDITPALKQSIEELPIVLELTYELQPLVLNWMNQLIGSKGYMLVQLNEKDQLEYRGYFNNKGNTYMVALNPK